MFGGIQQLRGQYFAIFVHLPNFTRTFCTINVDKKKTFFDLLSTSSCPSSIWTTPNTELLLLREKSTSCSKGRMTWLKAFAANRIYTFGSSSEWRLLEWLRKKSYGLFYVPIDERDSISLFHSSLLTDLTCTPHRIIHQLCEESKGRGDYFFLSFSLHPFYQECLVHRGSTWRGWQTEVKQSEQNNID